MIVDAASPFALHSTGATKPRRALAGARGLFGRMADFVANSRVFGSLVPALEGAWRACFADFDAFLRYCLPQDRAMSSQPWLERITSHEIHLGIDPAVCEPLEGEVRSRYATSLVGDARPICFRVPRVDFVFAVEIHDPLPQLGDAGVGG